MEVKCMFILCALTGVVLSSRIRRQADPCQENLVAETSAKVFTSANYPENYDDNTDCTWVVSAPVGEQVRVTFVKSVLEGCCDTLEVQDGTSAESSVIGTLRGDLSTQISYVSTSGALRIQFKSDESVTEMGFTATFQTVGSLEEEELEADIEAKVLTSPNFPNFYSNNLLTCWTLVSLEKHQVMLQFQNFSTELCCDYVTVFDMKTPPNQLATLRGSYRSIPVQYTSTSGSLRVCFTSNEALTSTGFSAIYISVPNQAPTTDPPVFGTCGGELTAPIVGHGEFRSPTLRGLYQNDLTCSWVIRAPQSGQQIRLWFPYLSTERCCDWIVVKDGETGDAIKLASVSGTSITFHTFISTSNVMRVDFTSDFVNAGRGFRAIYEINKNDSHLSTCGANLNANSMPQYFSSSNWPNGMYENNQNCTWNIRAPGTKRVVISLLGILTESDVDTIKVQFGSKEIFGTTQSLKKFSRPIIQNLNKENGYKTVYLPTSRPTCECSAAHLLRSTDLKYTVWCNEQYTTVWLRFSFCELLHNFGPIRRTVFRISGRTYVSIHAISLGSSLALEFKTDSKNTAGGFRAAYRSVSSTQQFFDLLRA